MISLEFSAEMPYFDFCLIQSIGVPRFVQFTLYL